MRQSGEYIEPTDVQGREKLRSPDALQLILTLFFFLGSLLLLIKYTACDWKWKIWVSVLFYGSLIWLAYLLLSVMIRFRNRGLKRAANYVDLLFFIFVLAMWIWLVDIIRRKEWLKACSDPVDLFGIAFFIIGLFFLLVLLVMIFGWICSKITPRPNGTLRNVINATDDVDFNPYD